MWLGKTHQLLWAPGWRNPVSGTGLQSSPVGIPPQLASSVQLGSESRRMERVELQEKQKGREEGCRKESRDQREVERQEGR